MAVLGRAWYNKLIIILRSMTMPQLMTKEQIDESAKKMINKAGASLVSAKGQDNLQLYYGYGEKLGEVIRFQNERSNINLLYRINGEKTICILGFPTVQWDD